MAQRPEINRFSKCWAFYTTKNDLAHISFVNDANTWLSTKAAALHFTYDTTSNWNNMDSSVLSGYEVILFLDTRPEVPEQRQALSIYEKRWCLDGLSLCRLCLNAFFLSPELELVPQ